MEKYRIFDDFDTQIQSDELDPSEYEEWCKLQEGEFEEDKSPKTECPKCGEFPTAFELTLNQGRCPYCDSIIA
jgi:hypothetical protein